MRNRNSIDFGWTPIRIALCVTYAAAIITLVFVI